MRRLLLVLALLAAGAASAATYALPDLRLGKGYIGPVVLDLTWADGTARDVTSVAGTVRVYSTATGALLWTLPVTPAGTPTNRMVFSVTATETGAVGVYALELDLVEGGVTDALHGQLVVEGRR